MYGILILQLRLSDPLCSFHRKPLPLLERPDHIIVPTTAYNNMVFVKGWAERFPRATFWGLEGVKLPGAKLTKDLTMKVRGGAQQYPSVAVARRFFFLCCVVCCVLHAGVSKELGWPAQYLASLGVRRSGDADSQILFFSPVAVPCFLH